MRRLGLLVALPLVLAVLAAPAPASAQEGDPELLDRRGAGASGPDVTLTGRGFGHGKGLSQYGALGRANAGHSYGRIIDFYYPDSGWGTAGGKLRILILGDSSPDVVVRDRSGLTVTAINSGRSWTPGAKADRWRIEPGDDGRSVVSYRDGAWHEWRTIRGPAEFSAPGPVTLVTPDGARAYRGALRSVVPWEHGSDGPMDRDTVNVVPLESYLRGVVPREVPALWPTAAVRAQSVAARTYAAFERADAPADRHYDLCDTAFCQVYGGVTDEHDGSDAAVAATSGRIRTQGGEAIFAQFSASNGGHSVDGGFSYLPAQPDKKDEQSYAAWDDEVTGAELEARWPTIGTFESITIDARDGNGSYGGRVVQMTVHGSAGDVTGIAGTTFASAFGLRSTLFDDPVLG